MASSPSLNLCFVMIFFAVTVAGQNTVCPFQYLYHFGDGATDVGNSVLLQPWGPSIPAARRPYGTSFPGNPNGRWSDGLVDFDFAAADFGFPVIVPYLSENSTRSHGVIFSVARSPVLDRYFFVSRGIRIPAYAVSLSTQLNWFKTHLKSVCTSPTDCRRRLANSLVLLGDIEANDIGYALIQGKSIEEVQSYMVPITRSQIKTTKELIMMGAKIIVIPASAPLGCFPYILTAFQTEDPTAYDDLGCLRSVNDLIRLKNNYLRQAINNLNREFRDATIIYGAFDEGVLTVLSNMSIAGNDRSKVLEACCGIGGKYKYSSNRFCGSPGVPVCADPSEHLFWDGIHFTQEASARIEQSLIQPTLVALNCTPLPGAFPPRNN